MRFPLKSKCKLCNVVEVITSEDALLYSREKYHFTKMGINENNLRSLDFVARY